MGRSISASPAQNSLFLTAGAAIANEDLLELGSDGKVYPVTDITGAIVANKDSNVYAETQVSSGYINSTHTGRCPMVKDSQGNLYVFTNNSHYSNITVYKYSASGALLASVGAVAIGTTTSSNTYDAKMKILSNGNILIAWSGSGSMQKPRFAILSPMLSVIKTATSIGDGSSSLSFGLTTLSGGGFAVVYDDYSANTQLKFATFDNAGTAVVAPTTIKTKGASSCRAWMLELSDGNLVIVYSQNTDHSYGVFTPGGVQVSAFTQISAYSDMSWAELSTIAGTFCVAMANSAAEISYRICANDGTVLGTQTVTSSPASNTSPSHKLMNDGQNYYGVYSNSATSRLAIVKLPPAGTSKSSVDFSSTGYNAAIDAYISGSNFVWTAAVNSGGTASYYGCHTLDGVQVTAATPLSADSAPVDRSITAMDGGSSTLIACWCSTSKSFSKIIRKKVLNTAILGVADFAAAAGATVGVLYTSGAYRVNALNIAAPLAFDHSAANITGNKGILLPTSAILKGF